MKNILKNIAVAAAFVVALGSCDLDRFPHSRIPLETSLENIEDMEKWNISLLTGMRSTLYSSFSINPDIMSDLFSATSRFGNRHGDIHGWVNLTSQTSDLNVWDYLYGRLHEPNLMIEKGPNITLKGEVEMEKALQSKYLGNAHFFRAYIHSLIALRYAKPYSQSQESDLCIPLVLKYDVTARPGKSTQKQVYDQIFADLQKAEDYYNSIGVAAVKETVKGKARSKDFTFDAITALRARTYLYMGKYQEAYTEAKKLIDSGTYPLVAPAAENFTKMWREDDSKEDIFVSHISRPDELPYGGGHYSASTMDKEGVGKVKVNLPDYIPTQWLLDMYKDTDLRKSVYFSNENEYYHNIFFSGVTVVSKFRGNPAYTSNAKDPVWGVLPSGYIEPKHFRIAEFYLIAAEAAHNLGNNAEAVGLVNKLRKSRGLDEIATSGDETFKEIQEERTRELAFEGFRLWDLRRWNMPVKRHDHQVLAGGDIEFLYKGFLNVEVPAGDYRFVWPIPHKELQTNDGLKGQQNPGW